MPYGVEQRINYGNAQVLPQGPSVNAFVKQITEQKNDRDSFDFEKERFRISDEQRKEEQKREDELSKIRIIGDVLDPRNFDQLTHGDIRVAYTDLAKYLKSNPEASKADIFQMVTEKAGGIGYKSDQYKLLREQLAAESEDFKSDKNIDVNKALQLALQDGVGEINKTGRFDPNTFKLSKTITNRLPEIYKGSGSWIPDYKPGEIMHYDTSLENVTSRLGGNVDDFEVDYNGIMYNLKTNNGGKPELITNGVETEAGGKKIMVLGDDAYNRYIVNREKRHDIDMRVRNKYPGIDPASEDAEKYRRAEAYNDVESYKPPIRVKEKNKENRATNISNYINTGAGGEKDLLDYDILGTYENKIKPIRKGTITRKDGKVTKEDWGESFNSVETKDIDKRDLELIDTPPYSDNGAIYYKIRPDGDWEGDGGQVISWAKIAQANMDKTALNEAARGRTKLTADKTKTPQPNDKTRKYKGLDKNGNPIFE